MVEKPDLISATPQYALVLFKNSLEATVSLKDIARPQEMPPTLLDGDFAPDSHSESDASEQLPSSSRDLSSEKLSDSTFTEPEVMNQNYESPHRTPIDGDNVPLAASEQNLEENAHFTINTHSQAT